MFWKKISSFLKKKKINDLTYHINNACLKASEKYALFLYYNNIFVITDCYELSDFGKETYCCNFIHKKMNGVISHTILTNILTANDINVEYFIALYLSVH